MINQRIFPALGVTALLAVASSAFGQTTFTIPAADFAANPGNLDNDGLPTTGTPLNSVHTQVVGAGYVLGNGVRVNSGSITLVAAGETRGESGFRLESSSHPGLFTYFTLTGSALTTSGFSVPANALEIRALGNSGNNAWNSQDTLHEGAAIGAGSTWTAEAYNQWDDAPGNDASGTGISFTINPAVTYGAPPAQVPPPAIAGMSVLYDNGSFVNVTGGGFNGANASLLLSGTSGTFGNNASGTFSLVDDFTVPPGPGWDVSVVSGYGYLTGTYSDPPVSPLTGVTVRIYDGKPWAGGTVVATSFALHGTQWTGAYRATTAAPLGATRPVFTAQADFSMPTPLHLNPGTYYCEYVTVGTTFTPYVNQAAPGQIGFYGNGRQGIATGFLYAAVQDVTPVSVPFTIYGPAVNQDLTGTLALGDTVGTFAFSRNIAYEVKQGVTTIASGTITASASSTALNISVPAANTGAAQLILNGSSFLRRVVNINLTGSNQAIGTATMQNGDANNSGEVDAVDIDDVIANFGFIGDDPTSVNADNEVDAVDIDIVIANFGGLDD